MAAYRRVYDSRHMQDDCQEPRSALDPYTTLSHDAIAISSVGYNSAYRVQLKGEDLWSYSRKIESVRLR